MNTHSTKKAGANPPWVRPVITLLVSLILSGTLSAALAQGTSSFVGIPVIWICTLLAFVIQWIAFVPAYFFKTERYYDLTGSLTYLTVIVLALSLGSSGSARSLLIAAMVIMWSSRLGWFLFKRIQSDGKDSRFDAIRNSLPRFFVAWTLQGLWVVMTIPAALVAITSEKQMALGLLDFIGACIWGAGFGIEALADAQKRFFRRDPNNHGQFIRSGLWAWSRHPNYFGEIILWIGIAVMASSIFEGLQWLAWLSPVFVSFLLTKISGVPLLEAQADKRWGGHSDYEIYKAKTPVLIPRRPR